MAKFLVILHAPGVTRDNFTESAHGIVQNVHATFVHSYANLVDGTIVNIYEATDASQVEEEMERLGRPVDEIFKIQHKVSLDDLTTTV